MAKQEEILALIDSWRSSGKTKAAFARESGMSVNTFHYWCNRYDERKRRRTPPAFVQVPDGVDGSPRSDRARLQLALPDGLVITVY